MDKKVILMILDGWGKSPDPKVSAVDNAKTPFIDNLYDQYPNANLLTYGMNVGLPDGQMGNSEVGHMNIGAGRIVYQDLAKINLAIEEQTLANEETLQKGINYAKTNNKKIHLMGLMSDGGVHSHINHLKALISVLEDEGLKDIYVHGFTDGRDVDPKSGLDFVKDLQDFISDKNTKLASLIGRYYAMDRDNRWERIALAYDLLVNAKGTQTADVIKSIEESYDNNITDEFLEPIVVTDTDNTPVAKIAEGDVVLFFNFRTDRSRQLTQALHQHKIEGQEMTPLDLYYITMTNYDANFKNVNVIYNKDNIADTLGATISKQQKQQIRIAETEKYPHVTFFFNGGREEPFEGEKRILCPSPKVATYDLQPEMSAYDVTAAIVPELEKGEVDFVCLNFANPDMVGHTGIMSAAVKACEVIDECTQKIVETAINQNYTVIVIADHGNCDTMVNKDGSPNTAHTTNLVPVILVDKDYKQIKDGKLGDIAPTILKLMNIPQPKLMTGETLV